ncbi:unnamed protein product, partial [Effrenium voratum]
SPFVWCSTAAPSAPTTRRGTSSTPSRSGLGSCPWTPWTSLPRRSWSSADLA